jgi:sulfatase maturation enzyme AslB (radical SAM superfamily)
VQNFFKKYNDFTSLTISLDGSKDLHDSCRLDLEGQGTYDQVLKAITHYRENFGLLQNTKMTFAPNNICYVQDALTNLINNQYIFISCNCIFEKGWNYDHATIYYNQLKQVTDYLIDNNLYNKVNIRIFNENDY